jgi:Fanconi anemia group D2 protein
VSGRFLRDIFCTARKDKNVSLLKLIPIAKSRRERFIYRVKGLLTANNSISAFWMGNLLNKDLDGEEIPTEV